MALFDIASRLMLKQSFFVNRDTGAVSTVIGGTATPGLLALLGTDLTLEVGFHDGAVADVLTHVEGSLNVSAQGVELLDAASPALLFAEPVAAGDGAACRYTFTIPCDTAALRTLIIGKVYLDIAFQIEWQVSGEASPRKSYIFIVRLMNATKLAA